MFCPAEGPGLDTAFLSARVVESNTNEAGEIDNVFMPSAESLHTVSNKFLCEHELRTAGQPLW